MVLLIASSWWISTGWSGRALLPRCMVRISWFLFCMLDHTDQVFGFPSKNRIHYVMMFNKLTLNKWMLYECPFFSFFLLLLQETSGFRAGDSIACGYCHWPFVQCYYFFVFPSPDNRVSQLSRLYWSSAAPSEKRHPDGTSSPSRLLIHCAFLILSNALLIWSLSPSRL